MKSPKTKIFAACVYEDKPRLLQPTSRKRNASDSLILTLVDNPGEAPLLTIIFRYYEGRMGVEIQCTGSNYLEWVMVRTWLPENELVFSRLEVDRRTEFEWSSVPMKGLRLGAVMIETLIGCQDEPFIAPQLLEQLPLMKGNGWTTPCWSLADSSVRSNYHIGDSEHMELD